MFTFSASTVVSRRLLVAAMAASLLALQVVAAQAQEVTDKDILDTIEAYKKAIYDSQDKDSGRFPGKWDGHGSAACGTGITTLSLLVSGESMQRDEIVKALDFLEKTPPTNIYEVGELAHVWSYLPFASYLPYEDKLAEACKLILASKRAPGIKPEDMVWGRYNVGKPSPGDDLSVTQYMVLGLWQGRKRGIQIDPYIWDAMAQQIIKRQNPDGGWGYSPGDLSTQTMTTAGMTILFVCQQERDRAKMKADPTMTASLERGQTWVEKNFSVAVDPASHAASSGLDGYQDYGYERIALASGLRYIHGQDWFTSIAGKIVKDGVAGAGYQENRAFKLMFLSAGKSQVWCNKIIVPGANCRNRPNDIYFANKWLSEMTKGSLNWLCVDVNSTSDRWLNAPISYISTDAKLDLDEAQEKNIRNYVDHGGILILNGENGEGQSWAREFAKKLYPKFPLGKPLSEGMLADGFSNGEIPGVQTVNNGARDLVAVVGGDFGMKWQSDIEPDYKATAWHFLFNLYKVASDRGQKMTQTGRPITRLTSPFELPGMAKTGEQIKVVIPKYVSDKSQSIAQPEGRPYDVMSIYVQNRTGMTVDVDKTLDLKDVGDSDGSLIHLIGTDAATLKPEELAALKAFVAKGGTVLVETVGGHTGPNGLFADSLRDPLQTAFGDGKTPAEMHSLADESPLVVGQVFKGDESSDCKRPLFRQATVEHGVKDGKLRVQAISVKDAAGKDRDAVLFSDEDLTLGMNKVRTYGINGYSQETAQHFMFNLLFEAGKSKPSPKMAVAADAPVADAPAEKKPQ